MVRFVTLPTHNKKTRYQKNCIHPYFTRANKALLWNCGGRNHIDFLSPQSFLLLCIRVYWRIYGSYFGVHFSLLYTWIRSPGALAIFATKQRYHLPLFSFPSWLVSLSLWETWKSFSTSASLIHFRQNVISSTASLSWKFIGVCSMSSSWMK